MKLTAEKLAEAMRAATSSPALRQKAAALGEKIRSEDGIANAIAIIKSAV